MLIIYIYICTVGYKSITLAYTSYELVDKKWIGRKVYIHNRYVYVGKCVRVEHSFLNIFSNYFIFEFKRFILLLDCQVGLFFKKKRRKETERISFFFLTRLILVETLRSQYFCGRLYIDVTRRVERCLRVVRPLAIQRVDIDLASWRFLYTYI